jgi:hypothetical protein
MMAKFLPTTAMLSLSKYRNGESPQLHKEARANEVISMPTGAVDRRLSYRQVQIVDATRERRA